MGLLTLGTGLFCQASMQARAQQDSEDVPRTGETVPGKAEQKAREKRVVELPVVEITAEKRTGDIQKTAMSVTAIEGEEITRSGKSDLAQVLSAVPGLVTQSTSRGYAIAIRGLGYDLPPGFGESAVAYNVDGVYNSRAEAGKSGYYDLANVEVLRGPQGTLYGRNSTAGVVNANSNDPVDHLEYGGALSVGNYGLFQTQGMANLPLSEDLALRAAFSTINRDGYLSSGQDDAVSRSARVKLLYRPSDNFSLLIGSELTRLAGKNSGYVAWDSGDPPTDPYHVGSSVAADSYDRSLYRKVYARLEWQFDLARLTFLPAYQHMEDSAAYTFDGGDSLVYVHDPKHFAQKSAELRLASLDGSRVKWVGGFFYYDSDQVSDSVNPSRSTVQTYNANARSKAAFFEATYPLAGHLRLTTGVRRSRDDKSARQYTDESGAVTALAGNDSWLRTDYKIGLEGDVGANSLLYATLSTGYRPGGFNMYGSGDAFKPETLRSLEVGSKNRFLNGHMQLNAAAFHYTYNNYQAVSTVSVSNDSPLVVSVVNAPQAKLFGGELESVLMPGADDRISLGISYLHSRYSDLMLNGIDLDGHVMAHAPAWTFNASYGHDWYLLNGSHLNTTIEMHHQTKSYTSPVPSDYSLQPAYTTGNISLAYFPARGRWSLTAFVRNVTDEVIKTGYTAPNLIALGAPRTYGLAFSYAFDESEPQP